MATTTTHYGFDIPQSTDLVKDGATAIATLGQDIDTAMNTALGTKKSGLVLLNTTSFSGVSSFSFAADTFTSTYDNYELHLRLETSSNSPTISWRGRTAGTDNSSALYNKQETYFDNTTSSGARAITQTSGSLQASSTTGGILVSNIFGPKAAVKTALISVGYNYFGSTTPYMNLVGSAYNDTTSFDSMTILVSTGTMTGTYSIFGVNK